MADFTSEGARNASEISVEDWCGPASRKELSENVLSNDKRKIVIGLFAGAELAGNEAVPFDREQRGRNPASRDLLIEVLDPIISRVEELVGDDDRAVHLPAIWLFVSFRRLIKKSGVMPSNPILERLLGAWLLDVDAHLLFVLARDDEAHTMPVVQTEMIRCSCAPNYLLSFGNANPFRPWEDPMPFKPNYGRDRAKGQRAARSRTEEKQRKKEEKATLRKAQREAAVAPSPDEPTVRSEAPQVVEGERLTSARGMKEN